MGNVSNERVHAGLSMPEHGVFSPGRTRKVKYTVKRSGLASCDGRKLPIHYPQRLGAY